MKISTALQIGGLFPILLGILVSLSLLSLFLRSQHVERAERLVQATSVLTQKAACLHIATYHSILNRSPETTGRWQEEIEELAAAAKSVPAGCAVERIMVDRVLENIKLLRQTYNEFAMAAPNAAAYGSPLTIQLLAAFDRVMRNALELGESAESQLRESWGSVDLYFAMFIGIAGLALAGATLSISRDVIARIQSLREWTQRVAAGDFEAKPSVRRSGDELAALENDVAAMIHHLKLACAEVEKQVEEHRKAAASSKESSAMLTTALERLKKAQEEIIRQERLTVLKRTLEGISRNFRDDLTPIITLSDLLSSHPERMENHEAMREIVSVLSDSARRAKKRLQELERIFEPTPVSNTEPSDLNALLGEVVQEMEPVWKDAPMARGVSISVVTAYGRLPLVACDRRLMKDAFSELIENAIEAMPSGGQIVVRTHEDNTSARIEITDTGIGMPRDILSKCIEPFFSTKQAGGAGMGLTLASGIVRDHGGRLDLSSEPGRGTTVSIFLPAWNPAADKR